MRQCLVVAIALAVVAFHAGRLEAANFTVNPMQVVFTPTRKSAVVTLKNVSKDELRFQIRVFTWEQSARGDMQLGDTTDVVFFPQLLVLGPGQQRPIRLAPRASFSWIKSYRVNIPLASSFKGTVAHSRFECRTRRRSSLTSGRSGAHRVAETVTHDRRSRPPMACGCLDGHSRGRVASAVYRRGSNRRSLHD